MRRCVHVAESAKHEWERARRRRRGTHLFEEQLVQLALAVVHAGPVGRVDDPDDGVRLLEVVAPVRPQRGLPADVPCGEEEEERVSGSRSGGPAACAGRSEESAGSLHAQTLRLKPWWKMVRMLKPRVGLTSSTFSPRIALQMVVLPALSKPLWEGASQLWWHCARVGERGRTA